MKEDGIISERIFRSWEKNYEKNHEFEGKDIIPWENLFPIDIQKYINLKRDQVLPRDQHYSSSQTDAYYEEEKSYLLKKIDPKKKEKFFNKKLENILRDKKKLEQFSLLKSMALKMEDPSECLEWTKEEVEVLQRWKIPIGDDPLYEKLSYFQLRDKLFEKSKKLKLGMDKLLDHEKKTYKERDDFFSSRLNFSKDQWSSHLRKINKIPLWSNKGEELRKKLRVDEKNIGKDKLYYKIKLSSGSSVYVGKRDHGNDILRNQIGKKGDLWIHLENYPGAHCLVKDDGKNIQDLDWDYLGSLLRDESKVLWNPIPLVYSRWEDVSGMKGSPGRVVLKKPRYRVVSYRADWITYFKEMNREE
jgi:predicted ribosome quality control (RQC) complex YloA/Tae2 family protein